MSKKVQRTQREIKVRKEGTLYPALERQVKVRTAKRNKMDNSIISFQCHAAADWRIFVNLYLLTYHNLPRSLLIAKIFRSLSPIER